MDVISSQWQDLTSPFAILIEIAQKSHQVSPIIDVTQAVGIAALVDTIARECKRTHRRDAHLVTLCNDAARLLWSIIETNDEAATAIRQKHSALVRRLLSVVSGLCSNCNRANGSRSPGCYCASLDALSIALSLMARLIDVNTPVTLFDEGSPTIRHSINKLMPDVISSKAENTRLLIDHIKSLPPPVKTNKHSRGNGSANIDINITSPTHIRSATQQRQDKSLLTLLGLTNVPLRASSAAPPQPIPVPKSRSRAKSGKPLIHHDSSQSSSGASSPHSIMPTPSFNQSINQIPQNPSSWLPRYSPPHPPHLTNVPTFVPNPYMDRLSQSAPITHYLVQTATSSIRHSQSSSRDEFSLSQSPFSSPDDGEPQAINDENQTIFHFEHFEDPNEEKKQDNSQTNQSANQSDNLSINQSVDEYMDFSPLLPVVHSPLHARLSSPDRRNKYSTLSTEEVALMIEARHAKAAALRDATLARASDKLRSTTVQLNLDKRSKAESLIQQQRKEKLDDRLHTAAANHEEILAAKRRRAESENVKVAEVMFIKALEAARAEDRKLAIDRKLSETERRREAVKAAKAQTAAELMKKQESIKAKQRASNDHLKAKIADKLHAAEQRRVQARSASHSHKSSLSLLPQPRSANSAEEDSTPVTPRKSQLRQIIRPASSPAKPPSSFSSSKSLMVDNTISTFTIDQLRSLNVPSMDELLTPNTDDASDLPLTPEKSMPFFCQTCNEILVDSAAVTTHMEASDCAESSIVLYDCKTLGRQIALAPSKSSRRNQKKKAHKLKLKLSRSQTGTETVSVVADLEALRCDESVRMSLIYKPVLSLLSHLAEIESARSSDVSNVLMSSAEWLATLLVRTQTLSKSLSQSHGDLPVEALGRIFRCLVGWSLTLPLPADALTDLARLALDCLKSVDPASRVLVLTDGACAVPALVGLVTGTLTQAIVTANVRIGSRQPLLDARTSPHLPVVVQLLSMCLQVSNSAADALPDSLEWLNLAAVYGLTHRIAQLSVASAPYVAAAVECDQSTCFERDHEQVALSLMELLTQIARAPALSSATQLALQATGWAGSFQILITLLRAMAGHVSTENPPPIVHLLIVRGLMLLHEWLQKTEQSNLLLQQQFTTFKTVVKLVLSTPTLTSDELDMAAAVLDRLCECAETIESPISVDELTELFDAPLVDRLILMGPTRQHLTVAIDRHRSRVRN